jgi:hypothetical protein
MEFWFRKDNPTVMNEVCSAIPQSTIGDVINRAWVRIVKELPYIDVLMQTHDSLTMQYPIERAAEAHSAILDKMLIGIPYNPVLYIDSDIKVSRISYGDCEKIIH